MHARRIETSLNLPAHFVSFVCPQHRFNGTDGMYFREGPSGSHPVWGTCVSSAVDYVKGQS